LLGTSATIAVVAERVWFITGASSGFRREIARAALDRGDSVVVAARGADALDDLVRRDPERVLAVALDVTDAAARTRALDAAMQRFGRIDVLVNNAGRTQVGAVEETTEEELRYLFELHFFAPAALTRAVLPIMRAQGAGAIVQISSVGGRVTAEGNDRTQPGDPAKAAAAIIAALDADEPPLRLVLGEDATGNIRRRLSFLEEELDRWEPLGADTPLD
jgi:NAD(P)-dependent dehydrogenase (short-subunit alcohol dehydrogenase family)